MKIDLLKLKFNILHSYDEIPETNRFICCQLQGTLHENSDKDIKLFNELPEYYSKCKDNFDHCLVFGTLYKNKKGNHIFIESEPYFQITSQIVANNLHKKWSKIKEEAEAYDYQKLYWFYVADMIKLIKN